MPGRRLFPQGPRHRPCALGNDHPQWRTTCQSRRRAAVAGKLDEARPLFEESIALLPQSHWARSIPIRSMRWATRPFLQAAGDLPAAEAMFRQTLALDVEVRGRPTLHRLTIT